MTTQSSPDALPQNQADLRSAILNEINDLKETAQAFGWDAIKSGSWFNDFLLA